MMDQWMEHPKKIIFTIGYEGLKIDNFVLILKSFKIKRIIDVRRNPYSRNSFYIKEKLSDILHENNIEYLHTPEIAPTEQIRNKYKGTGDWKDYVEDYYKMIDNIKEIFETWVLKLRSYDCLLCMEKNANYCHRSLLGKRLEQSFIVMNIKREGGEKA